MFELRCNLKCKFSQVNGLVFDFLEDFFIVVYELFIDWEREEWEGWVELESDFVCFCY